MRDFYDVVKLTVGFLNGNKIPYMVVGAVSVAVWGAPRTSQDIDIIIHLKDDDIKKFADFCKNNKLSVDEEEIKQAFEERSHFTVFDDESTYRLDLKGIYNDFDRISFSRRRKVEFRDFVLWINSPEDCILAKLLFGSLQDLNDAKTILLRQKGKLDMRYVKEQARHFKLLGKLDSLTSSLPSL